VARLLRELSLRPRLLVCAVLLLALVPSTSAAGGNTNGGSRRAAAHDALHALRASRHHGAELVLGLVDPLQAGTVVSVAGPPRAETRDRVASSAARTIAVLRAPAWLFYQDLAPFQQYSHAGRVALVDAATGRVTLSGTLAWPPLVNGALPAFLATQRAYDSARYRVLYRPYLGRGAGGAGDARAGVAARAARAFGAALDPTLAPVVAGLLAAQHACTFRFSDTVPGGYYAFAQIAQSRAALDYRFSQLAHFAPSLHSWIYSTASGLSPTGFVTRMISHHGCRDVLLYLAGGGYAQGNAINIGMGTDAGNVLHQDVTVAELRSLAHSHPGVRFELVFDAPHTHRFQSLIGASNVLLVATPAAGGFTFLPAASENGVLIPNHVDPLHILQLTDRLAFGIDQLVDSPSEVSQMRSLAQSGQLPSALAYLIVRGFELGAPVDFVANSGVGSPPLVGTRIPVGPPTHHAPALSGIESTTLQYAAGTPAVPVTAGLTITTPNVPILTGATVSISSGLVPSEDALAFTNRNGIIGSYDSATGVLVLSGTSSVANYQAALRSVTYRDSNGTSPTTGTRTISFEVGIGNSPTNASNTVSRDVNVNPNTPPVAQNDSASTDKNTAIDINVLANDSDPDGDAVFVASLNTTGTKGLVSINGDGTIHYDPNGQFAILQQGQSATDTFTYQASDGYHSSSSATVTVTISGVNDPPPVLSNVESSTLQYDAGSPEVPVTNTIAISSRHGPNLAGATVSISSGLAPGEDGLTFVNQNGVTGSYDSATGVLTLTGTSSLANYQAALRSVSYADSNGTTPATGSRTIGFQVDDGAASNNMSNVASRQVQVNPNPPPVAHNDAASTNKHTAIDIAVLANDTDADGDPVHVASVDTTGTKGSVSINGDGTIHYDPNGQFENLQEGQTATDIFTYQDTDSYHNSNSGTVTVTINGSNDPPVLANIESSAIPYSAGTPPVEVTGALTASDPDDTTLAGATVTISSGFVSGEDVLSFTNLNGITGNYNGATGVLALSGTASVADYQAALRSVTFADPNGATPTTGTRTVTFQVNDGHTANNLSNTESRNITVNRNSPPVANDDSASTDKHTAIDIAVLANDSDPDGDTLHVASVDTAGTTGSVSINPDGTIHYDPDGQFENLQAGQTATDTFTYQASDGFSNSNPATVTVTINGVNDPPVLSNIETSAASYRAQDSAIQVTNTLIAADPDDTTLAGATVAITSGFGSGTDTLSFTDQNGITGSYNSATGVLSLTGSSSVANYQTALRSVLFSSSDSSTTPATRTITFQLNDGHASNNLSNAQSRSINVSEANQAPVAQNQSYNAVGNTPLGVGTMPTGPAVTQTGSVLNGDSDPDSGSPITLTGNSQPAHGSVVMDSDGTFTYAPAAGFSGVDSFTYTITDTDDPNNPKTATGTVTITVGPVVWYVDNSKSAGSGTSTSPFNTLAAANTVAGADSIVFLYQGSGNYTGGIALHSGEDLFGQPHGLTVNGSALVAAGGSNPTITNSGGNGIELAENSDVEGVNVSSPSGNGIAASGVNDATVGSVSPVAIVGAGGDGIHISNGNGTLDFADASVTGSTGHSVSMSGRTGGTVTFGGSISDQGTGISLTSNTGATTDFTGTVTADTGPNPAFTATGGGTVNATGNGSTLATTTGTALDIENTAIGASGLTVKSISAGTASSGPARAITLISTGSAAGLTVTGTGTTAGSGGAIQHTISTGSTETFGGGNGGVYLDDTTDVSLANMDVNAASGGSGIYGTGVTNLSLSGDSLAGNGTSNTNDDDGVRIDGLTGTGTISSTTISSSAEADGRIVSGTSGSLTMDVTDSTFETAAAGDGLLVEPNGASVTTTASGDTFTGNFDDGLQVAANGAGAVTVVATSNTVTNNTGAGIDLGSGGGIAPPGAFTISGNTVTGQQGSGINVANLGNGTWTGHVTGNTVGNPAATDSGSKAGWGIIVKQEGSGTLTADVSNNTVRQIESFNGIDGTTENGNGTLNLTMTGNNIDTSQVTSEDGIFVNSGSLSTDANTVCLDATGNTSQSEGSSNPPPNGNGIFDATGFAVSNSDAGTTFKIQGLGADTTLDSAVQTHLESTNILAAQSGSVDPGGESFAQHNASGPGWAAATTCPTAPAGP
jgi:VCBS repeat-containing protein